MISSIQTRIQEFASRLRFPKLFMITLVVLVIDILTPDLIPFVDEILLALVTALLGAWKRRRTPRQGE